MLRLSVDIKSSGKNVEEVKTSCYFCGENLSSILKVKRKSNSCAGSCHFRVSTFFRDNLNARRKKTKWEEEKLHPYLKFNNQIEMLDL